MAKLHLARHTNKNFYRRGDGVKKKAILVLSISFVVLMAAVFILKFLNGDSSSWPDFGKSAPHFAFISQKDSI
jgi:hypothetical protein